MTKIIKEPRTDTLSILQAEAEKRLAQNFPTLYREELTMIDPKSTRLVIDDISYRAVQPVTEALEFLFLACQGEVQSYDARRQTRMLASKIARLKSVLNTKRTMVIFPGNGGQVVKDLLPADLLTDMAVVSIPVTRSVNPKTKAIEGVTVAGVTQARKIISDARISAFVVIDDAIVTGSTLTALRESLPMRGSEWYAGGLFMLSPIQNKGKAKGPSGVEDFNSIIAPTVYQGVSGIPALNSLSTLIGSSEKSKAVRSRYIRDFVEDPGMFTEMVQQLQKSVSLER